MADNYIDRLTAMQGKYRLGGSTYSYIGQVKISHIFKGRDFVTEFHALVSDVTKVFAVELPEIILLPFLDDKVDCIAFINCRDNYDHLRIIGLFDDRMFRGKRLAAKPNGFTNLRFDPTGESKYRAQRTIVSLFNTLNYRGSRNTALATPLDTSIRQQIVRLIGTLRYRASSPIIQFRRQPKWKLKLKKTITAKKR